MALSDQVCARLELKNWFHTSFAGSRPLHFNDGGEDCVVPVPLAHQVNYPVNNLFDGIAIQAMVISGLNLKRKKTKTKKK